MDFDQNLDITIQLINNVGQELITMELQKINSVRQTFDWEKLPKGIYWLSISSNDKKLVKKFLID